MFALKLILMFEDNYAFHWQYGDILLAIYFFLYLYFVLSLKNKYTILYYYLGETCTGALSIHEGRDRQSKVCT